ncbi:MAG: slipin family protein, partial [Candidatus Competibacteraceae bacterium]|nr:slipin family protein [Candidatus Competibacteraceae bacterium]
MEGMLGFLVFLLAYTLSSLKVIKEYEKIVVFTLGRADGVKGPGLQFVWPIFQQSK